MLRAQDVLNEMFGEPISTYTTEQAIEDGTLIHPYPSRWPWLLITPNIHGACDRDKGRTYDQALVPLLMDAIMACQKPSGRRKFNSDDPVILDHTVAGTVWCMRNEKGGITVMTPSEY